MNSGEVLIVPACERGVGGGHLGRSLFLFQSLLERGRSAYLWIPEHLKDDVILRFGEFFGAFARPQNAHSGETTRLLSKKEELSAHAWDFIVLDFFKTQVNDFAFWSGFGPLIGIDEGGPRRNRFDFIIDLLPGFAGHPPNMTAPGLLPLPRNRAGARGSLPPGPHPPAAVNASGESGAIRVIGGSSVPGESGRPGGAGKNIPGESKAAALKINSTRILISFGAEDAAGLGFSAARSLAGASLKKSGKNPPEITLVAPVPPRDNSDTALWERGGVRVISKLPKLREHLVEYDLLITHFGLGAFEAVYARLPVLLLSPTAYHEKLSRNAGFFSLGNGAKSFRQLGKLAFSNEFLETLRRRGGEIARRFGLEEDQKEDLGSFVCGLAPRALRSCPVCGEKTGPGNIHPVLARFPDETYRRCSRCGLIYLGRLNAPPIEYEKDYFFDFYKRQYGKTYIEDFPNLMEMGRKRLAHIRSLLASAAKPRLNGLKTPDLKSSGPKLLDIGCAYGPFLAAAAECGFSPVGIEPAKDAVRYITEELKFPAWHGFFPPPLDEGENAGSKDLRETFKDGGFDVITLWYVIEHFEDCGKVLREIHRLLKEGGVLAFSTPSFSGISGRKRLRSFLKQSPPDHWTVWNPRVCGRIFRQYGFCLRKIVITGHHPERFPLLGRFARPGKKGFLYRLLLCASRLFRLGDTFEAYGVKTGSPRRGFFPGQRR